MAARASGKITYVALVDKNERVRLDVQGVVKIVKGAFDWLGIVAWDTSWRFFDPYGKLLYRDDRHHSIMPMATYDEAYESFTVSLPKYSYYNIQLYGPVAGVLDTVTFNISEVKKVAPPPVVPSPAPPAPIIPEPAPVIPKPTPVACSIDADCPKGYICKDGVCVKKEEIPTWLIPALVIGAAVLLLPKGKEK